MWVSCPPLCAHTVSLRWMKLPPVRTAGREHTREGPYMRYGHTAVLLEDIIYIWGGRNDTEGACNVLYAFDVSKYPYVHLVPFWCGCGGVCSNCPRHLLYAVVVVWNGMQEEAGVFHPSRFRHRLLKCGTAFRLTQIKIAALFYDFLRTHLVKRRDASPLT